DSPAVATLRVFFALNFPLPRPCPHGIRCSQDFTQNPIFMGWAALPSVDRLKPLLDFPQEWILPQWQHCGFFFARVLVNSVILAYKLAPVTVHLPNRHSLYC